MTELEMPADQRHPDAVIEIDRRLSDEEADELREHVKQHGLVDLPFGARVRLPGVAPCCPPSPHSPDRLEVRTMQEPWRSIAALAVILTLLFVFLKLTHLV